MSGPEFMTISRASREPFKIRSQQFNFHHRIKTANGMDGLGETSRAPPSSRSSRSTEVITACLSRRSLTAAATRAGSDSIQPGRLAGPHRTVCTGTGTDIPEDHEGGRSVLSPALGYIGTAGVFTHSVQTMDCEERHEPRSTLSPLGIRTFNQSGCRPMSHQYTASTRWKTRDHCLPRRPFKLSTAGRILSPAIDLTIRLTTPG